MTREQREELTNKPTVFFFDSLSDSEYPSGCFMCGFSGEDHYLGRSIPEALKKWCENN